MFNLHPAECSVNADCKIYIKIYRGICLILALLQTQQEKKAAELFEQGILKTFPFGIFEGLTNIHRYLVDEIYDFAGKIRTVNIAKGNFRFAPLIYLDAALKNIDHMTQSTFDEIVEKYVDMNIAHPFRDGNGRGTRIWLDCIFRQELGKVVDWSQVDKTDYLLAMERSPVKDIEIKVILKDALTNKIDDREVYMKGIDCNRRQSVTV